MDTPYVQLQRSLMDLFFHLKEYKPNSLRQIFLAAQESVEDINSRNDTLLLLVIEGFRPPSASPTWDPLTALSEAMNICKEQLVLTKEDTIEIRNLLGSPLYYRAPVDFQEFFERRGSGDNSLRTLRLAQPGTLKKGDILATGCRVLSEPREGGNGSVLLHLSGGHHGHWVGVPACIPIALLTPEDNVSEGYIQD